MLKFVVNFETNRTLDSCLIQEKTKEPGQHRHTFCFPILLKMRFSNFSKKNYLTCSTVTSQLVDFLEKNYMIFFQSQEN